MKQTRSLRIVDADIEAAFESAKVSFTTPIPVLTVVDPPDSEIELRNVSRKIPLPKPLLDKDLLKACLLYTSDAADE